MKSIRRKVETAYRLIGKVIPCDITKVLILDVNELKHAPLPQNYEYRNIDAATITQLSSSPQTELNVGVANLVDSGKAICMAAFKDKELAAYSLFSQSPVAAELNQGGSTFKGIGLSFGPDVQYLFKAFVLPEHRGSNLNRCIMQQAIAHAAPIRALVTTTDWTNHAFLKSAKSAGFNARGTAAEIVLLGKHLFTLPKPITLNSTDKNPHPITLTRPS